MLTGKQKQYLKSQAVQLPAYVQIGKEGLTDTVIDSVRDVLLARELGLAYQTTSRYLQYLHGEGQLQVENDYGKVGRPRNRYRKV